jgi:hypothetical protein
VDAGQPVAEGQPRQLALDEVDALALPAEQQVERDPSAITESRKSSTQSASSVCSSASS